MNAPAPNPRAVIGGNAPPPYDVEALDAEAKVTAEWLDAAGAWLDLKKIESAAQAGKLKDMIDGARKIRQRVDKQRLEAGKPHREAQKVVNDAYNRVIARLDLALKKLEPLATDWIKRENARLEAERREAERRAREEAEAAEAALRAAEARNDVSGMADAESAARAAQEAAEAAAAPVRARVASASGGGGKAMSLRKRRRVEVKNWKLAFLHVAHEPSVQEAVQKALNAKVNAARWSPEWELSGCVIHIEERAV